MIETITGKLKKVIYRSLDTSFMIGAFIDPHSKKQFTATGEIHKPIEELQYSLEGKWIENPQYGMQFQVSSYSVEEPCDSNSIAVYLEKHVNGIGPVLADMLIEKYRKHTIRLLKKAPERITNENKGISYDLALKISEQLQEGDKRQDVLIKLEGMFAKVKGLPKRLATDVLNVYGLSAYEVIKNNPYQLVEMNRIGFVSADKVGMSCGIKPDANERIKAGLLYVMKQHINDSGDIWLKINMISDSLSTLIDGLKAVVVADMIVQMIKDKVLVKRGGFVTFERYDKDETIIADCVGRFLNG